MSCRHEKVFDWLRPIAAAVEPVAQARIAAAIVYKRKVISIGWNQKKTDPFQLKFGANNECIFCHAEIYAIKHALRQLTIDELTKCSLYVARMKYESDRKTNMIQGLAKPCDGCQRAIVTFGIRKVMFTIDNQGFGDLTHVIN